MIGKTVIAVLTLLYLFSRCVSAGAELRERAVVDQEKLYYGSYGYMLYFDDDNSDSYHSPGEAYYAYPTGGSWYYDSSCWYASACGLTESEGLGNTYLHGLQHGAADSPATHPWGSSYSANSGSYRTFDDGGWQHWAFEFANHSYMGYINADSEFGSGSWSMDPVAWSQARIAEGHGVGVCLYSGLVPRGSLPGGYFPDQRSFYHAITIWEINPDSTMLITDSDDRVAGSRIVDFTWSGNDWVIQDLYPGADANINYAVSLAQNSLQTISSAISCQPGSGVLPFATLIRVDLENTYPQKIRRIAAHLDVLLANGGSIPNWRSGWTNVAAGDTYTGQWSQNLPYLAALVGDTVFSILAEDVTPSPYNQPPYPPSGDTAADGCTVTGIAP